MDTYYARHTMVIGIDQPTREKLWDKRLIAIHSPDNMDGKLPPDKDNSSLNPYDHSPQGRRRLNALLRLSKNGGFVYAEYWMSDTKVHKVCGIVKPGTPIEHFYGTWGSRYPGCLGRPADLLGVQLVEIKYDVPVFSGVPARSTLCQWHSIGSKVADLFK